MKLVFIFMSVFGCSTYEHYQRLPKELEIPTQLFHYSLNDTWAAVVNVMKNYDIETQDLERGLIKTKWMDNTLETNFSDSFGSKDKVKSARFRLLVRISTLNTIDDNKTKVIIFKRQIVENDYLQGWKEIKYDKSLEKVLLYRIGREIKLEKYLSQIQKEKEEKQLKEIEQL